MLTSNPNILLPMGSGGPIYGKLPPPVAITQPPTPTNPSGAFQWTEGVGAPTSPPTSGIMGYMDSNTGDLYRWVGGAWV